MRGDQKETSDDAYIYVREGVPWSPTELIFYKENKSAISYHLNWKTKNPENVDGYLILVAYENETVAIETSHTTYRFDGVLPEDAQYKIQVGIRLFVWLLLKIMLNLILSHWCKLLSLVTNTKFNLLYQDKPLAIEIMHLLSCIISNFQFLMDFERNTVFSIFIPQRSNTVKCQY